MSQSIDFVPSTTGPFTFQPSINGTTYSAVVTWNLFGQRYYLSLFGLNGKLVVCRAVNSSGPRLGATFTWANGFATATTALPHQVPLGSVAALRASGAAGYEGIFRMEAIAPMQLMYVLPNPGTDVALTGTVFQPLNLCAGVAALTPGWLLYHYDLQQFEFESTG